ncbi:MAG: DegT/DnrJ/EryC1/StrS family aminotransferase [PVC group bacterium]
MKTVPVSQPSLGREELELVSRAVRTGWISYLGEYVQRFEEGFAGFCGVKYGCSVSSGTAALHLALLALGVGPGDEVIVPALTFVATANVVTFTGARPVFVDVRPGDFGIDPEGIEKAITARTRAVIAVHLYGNPCPMDRIMEIARRHKLSVIEDCAEAHGATYRGRRVGSFGAAGCFSFFGNKIMTTGEGGMVVTDSAHLRDTVNVLKDHGSRGRRYHHPVIGFNYRLTNLQCALGVAQLGRIDQLLADRSRIAETYGRHLRDVPGLTLPRDPEGAKSVCWLYSVLVGKRFGLTRDRLAARLGEKGIDSRPFFVPIHRLAPYRTKERFPVAESLSRKGLSLPTFNSLDDKTIRYICRTIKEISGR